jgi:predicted N-acetyltransferase YhbS
VLGTCTYTSGPGLYSEYKEEDFAGMRVLVVDSKHQNRGIGKLLVQESLDRAKRDKVS